MKEQWIPLGAGVQRNAAGEIEFIAIPVLVVPTVEPTSTELSSAFCPVCKTVHEVATNFTSKDARPTPGCASICAECGSVSTFQADMSLKLMTKEEFDALPRSAQIELIRHQLALREVKANMRSDWLRRKIASDSEGDIEAG